MTPDSRAAARGNGRPERSTGTTPVPTTVTDPADVPVALAVRVRVTRATRLVTIECPYCGKRHGHGVPYSSATRHRVAECGRGGYVIALPTEVAE
jgi:hypothetical protein